MCSLSCALLNVHFLFCVVFFVPEFDREPCAYLFAPPKERQAGPRPQWSSSFTCSTKTENRRRNKQSSKQSAVVFFLPETHKRIFDNTKQPQQPRQETQTTAPPDPPRFRSLSPKRQSAAATTHTRAFSTTSQKIVQCFLQKKKSQNFMAESMKRPAPRMRVHGAGLARNGQSAKAESDHFVSACVLADHAKKNGIGRVFKC